MWLILMSYVPWWIHDLIRALQTCYEYVILGVEGSP